MTSNEEWNREEYAQEGLMTVPLPRQPSHTWHRNTFGLLYGKTAKTACGKRVAAATIVHRLAPTCLRCQDAVIQELQLQQH